MVELLKSNAPLAVIGAGAWGTMLAILLTHNGNRVGLWARREDFAKRLLEERENKRYLAGVPLPDNLEISSNLNDLMQNRIAAFIAVPSKGLRNVMAYLPKVSALICASKGLEVGTLKRFSEVLAEYQPKALLAALSGPNLAFEIARGLPAAATVASESESFAKAVQHWLHQANFRVYSSNDLIGVELGGALKNIIALAAGMCDGLKMGDNAKAAIITRGLAEMIKFARHLGAKSETLFGLAGLGDMIATCNSLNSRNHKAGEMFAKGVSLAEVEASKMTTEGLSTTEAVVSYARAKGLELPIAFEVYKVIFESKAPKQAIEHLMQRELKAEWA